MSASRVQSVLSVRKVSTRRRSAWSGCPSGASSRSRTGRRMLGNFTPITLVRSSPLSRNGSEQMASGQRVGFLGLGLMGSGMAKNLATKGFQVTVWNRSREKATALEPLGAKVADTPATLMAEVDVACTCVATPAARAEREPGVGG